MKTTSIKASKFVQYSDRKIAVYSDTSCFFNFAVNIRDVDCVSTNYYGPFEISTGGEKKNFTIDELSPNFFSNKAKIAFVYPPTTFVYGDSSLSELNYNGINTDIQFKCYADKIVLRDNTDCFVSLILTTKDEDFESGKAYLERLEIDSNKPT